MIERDFDDRMRSKIEAISQEYERKLDILRSQNLTISSSNRKNKPSLSQEEETASKAYRYHPRNQRSQMFSGSKESAFRKSVIIGNLAYF